MIFSAFLASLSHLFFKCKHLFESSCALIRLIHVVVVVVIHILVFFKSMYNIKACLIVSV